MKKLFSLLLGACTVFAACTDDVENIKQDGLTQLAVNVKVNPTSRAMVHGTALPGGSSIGINVTDATGNPYDGKDAGYLNVQYTATGEAGAQTWGATTPVLLSGTEGKMHAYYPWTTGIDYTAVAVDVADQIDWMYAADTYTVSDAKNAHEIVLSHAQTAVNVNLVRDASYTGVGAVEALTVTSEGLASTASLDTRDGSFASVTGANTAISIIEAPYTLDGTTLSSQENPYMFIPASAETKDFTVSTTLDGKSYSHKVTMAEAFAPGKVYKINVTFKNTGLEVSTVTLVDWNETELGNAEFKPVVAPSTPSGPAIDATGKANGVYAVSATGSLINYNSADATALGVALVADEHKFMIAKKDAFDGTYATLSWTKSYSDLSLTNYSKSDGTNSTGYLPKTDGTYQATPHLSDDYTTWTAGALSDFNGKANTAVIAEASSDARDMCSVLNTFNASNSFKDWYVPACGQLALMYLNKTEINAALAKIEGTALDTGFYWSSSELSSTDAWRVLFNNGNVGNSGLKDYSYRVRFIRDI